MRLFKQRLVKRIGNLYEQIYSIDNLVLAETKARKGKSKSFGIKEFDRNHKNNLIILSEVIKNRKYKTSKYSTFKVFEPKERVVFRLPYYPDRITHHAIMNVLEPIFTSMFTANTYSCIKGKGIHAAVNKVKEALKDKDNTTYCLKLDITKFYPSVNHEVLKQIIRRKIKDKDLLWLLDEIIESTFGIPIGNYTSQIFANLYLTGFDHWLKEEKKVKYYFRYADDMVILSNSKQYLHALLSEIRTFLSEKLKLSIKSNYQVFPVKSRGIDFVGYIFFHTHTLLRKSIKKNFAKMIVNNKNDKSIASYYGWAVHCDSKNLLRKLLT